ncbi:hypothetical protein FXO38_14204 [Capsicum annuum]|nr:hypothetical protein FXO38_14204 [Capsicum annuum]
MKLIALVKGLTIAERENLVPLKINIDSKEVIIMLKQGNLHYNALLDECRLRLRMLECPPISHCYREQSDVADLLAKFGAATGHHQNTLFFKVPPVCAQNVPWADIT